MALRAPVQCVPKRCRESGPFSGGNPDRLTSVQLVHKRTKKDPARNDKTRRKRPPPLYHFTSWKKGESRYWSPSRQLNRSSCIWKGGGMIFCSTFFLTIYFLFIFLDCSINWRGRRWRGAWGCCQRVDVHGRSSFCSDNQWTGGESWTRNWLRWERSLQTIPTILPIDQLSRTKLYNLPIQASSMFSSNSWTDFRGNFRVSVLELFCKNW